MRGKVIYRIAAGTCSVCITYGLITQAIDGVSTDQSAAEAWIVPGTAVVEHAPQPTTAQDYGYTVSENERWNSWRDGSSMSGRNSRQKGSRGRGNMGYTGSDPNSGYSGNYETASAEEDEKRAGTAQEQESVSASQQTASGDPPTLQQYLSLLRCSGCRHNCCLLSPRCMKGRTKQKNATVQYQTTYGG